MYPKDLKSSSIVSKELFDVKNKIVLVTGGGRGIGLMIAQGFVESGAKVIICGRNLKLCEEAARELTNKGTGSCYALEANLSLEKDCKKIAEEVSRRESHLDVLINNAGANWGSPFEDYPDSAWDKVLSLNVKGIFHLTKAMVPLLEKSQSGRVINIGSIDGLRVPHMETYAYSTSKAAVHHLSKHLALKLSSKNITVNAIAAGAFETKMMKETLDKFRDVIISRIPLSRIGLPSDIAGTCIFLSSKASSWITGTVITLDGGTVLGSSL